jgi:hypothetical protein
LDRAVVGFWVGGIVLGVSGCIVGGLMPYRHPVGVALSVLWWGIYLGCAGASIVSLACWLTQREPEGRRKRAGRAGGPRRLSARAHLPEGYRDQFAAALTVDDRLRVE